MPALLGPLVGFTLGVALAWLSRGEAERDDEEAGSARALAVALFAVLVYAPACAYFLIFAPDWSLAYLADSRVIPSALDLALVLLDAGIVVLGFLAGRRATRRRADRALVALAAAPLAIAVAAMFALFGRLRIEGTFLQVRNDFGTRAVAGGPLGYAILWVGAMVVAGFVVTARSLAGRRAAARPTGASGPAAWLGRRRK